MPQQASVTVQFHAPPADLRRYFTSFYLTEIATPADAPLTDALQPEWANLRFFSGATPRVRIAGGPVLAGSDGGPVLAGSDFVATGPSSRCAHFTLGPGRLWGVGLLPLGWARFVGQPAAEHANLVTDGHAHPSFAPFRALAASLFGPAPDPPGELERIVAAFRALPAPSRVDEARINAIHAALVDPRIGSVAALVAAVGTSQRTIERTCDLAFGFAPKLLLRRQRFMRSLAQFMLDPGRGWTGAIDAQYHDQAQFVRDFHDFMGLAPSAYAAQPHPVLEQFVRQRAQVRGSAMQTLDRPAL